MPIWKSDDATGRRAREYCQCWGFEPIKPKFDSSKGKTWKLFEGWYYLIAPIPSHHAKKNCTSSCPWCLYLTPKNAKAWILRLYCTFGYQNNSSKMSILKINFLCAISLTSASISTKNELLTHWIDKDMKFWSMTPSANPLKHPKCTTFGTFLRPSTPPHAILNASDFHE